MSQRGGGRGRQPPSNPSRGGRGRGRAGPNQPPSSFSSSPAFPMTTSSSAAAPSSRQNVAPYAASSSSAPSPAPAVASAPAVEQARQMTEQKLVISDPGNKDGAPPPASSKSVRFAARPGFGKVGRKCLVKANHFLVEVADKDLRHYDVIFLISSLSSLYILMMCYMLEFRTHLINCR